MVERAIPERVFINSAVNVRGLERILSAVGCAWLLMRLLRDRRISNRSTKLAFTLSALALASRAVTGQSRIYSAFKIGTAKPSTKTPESTSVGAVSAIQRTITIRASTEEIQLFFDDAPKLAHASLELGAVLSQSERAIRLYLETGEILEGSLILIDGPVEKGTEIQARIYKIPYGFKTELADQTLRQVLRSAKQMIETGEVATVEGQAHGLRGQHETVTEKLKGRLRHASTLLERG